jgi:DNA (cytosine-5)-methyltransferase 1
VALRTLSICSGYGGIELGLSSVADIEPVCYIERDVAQASVLVSRIQEGLLPDAPIWSDLRTFRCEPWRGKVDVIVGGFPCQPHSVAGKKRGADDERNLWPEIVRLARELGNPTLFLENVPGILRWYHDVIKPELQGMGYRVAEGLYTAAETGAPHKRQRLFFLAHCQPEGLQGQPWYDGVHRRKIRTYVEHNGDEIRRRIGRRGTELAHRDSGLSDHEGQALCAGRDASDLGGFQLSHAEHFRCPAAEVGEGQPETIRGSEEGQNGPVQPAGIRSPRDAPSELADADGGPSIQYQLQEGSGYALRGDGELADASDTRPQRVRLAGEEERPSRPRYVPLYPPGPSDEIGWSYVFDQMPSLKPTFCRMVDGTSAKLDSARRLRSIGNGVVPAVAALAWRDLSEKMSAVHG